MFDIAQTESGKSVRIDRTRDQFLTRFGIETLKDRYMQPDDDGPQDLFARISMHYGDDTAHAQRIYDYMSNLWFMPSTPVLSNGGTNRGLPIACFLNEAQDSLESIIELWNENVWLSTRGGGIGSYWGNLRSIGEKIGKTGKSTGVIPYIKVQDSMTLAISQASLRRGSAAAYLPIWHPEIEEFIEIRRPTGGDPNRKSLNINQGVLVTNAFMIAVENDEEWGLKSPKDGSVVAKVKARDLWIRLLTARIETGEPYILFIDHVNERIPDHHKMAGLSVKMSNLCSEITLPTGIDHLGNDRTAVCCLSSLNLEKYDEWENHPTFIPDVMRFLDNVLSDFINTAPDTMKRAKYSAMRERSVGMGVMGFHAFLQSKSIPMEGVMAKVWNNRIFRHIKKQADEASVQLAHERGACPDAADYSIMERFSNKMAIAPTASISIICGGASPGIEPNAANAYTHKTLSGSFPVKNKYLEKLLDEKGLNTDDVWSSIFTNEGSVQHLEFLTDHEKDVFKTAFEIDQRWLIEHAADRTPFICQAQSLNLFLPANVHKRDLHGLHMMAWKMGLKSLYYCRSKSIQRAESDASWKRSIEGQKPKFDEPIQPDLIEANKYEECLSCQ